MLTRQIIPSALWLLLSTHLYTRWHGFPQNRENILFLFALGRRDYDRRRYR